MVAREENVVFILNVIKVENIQFCFMSFDKELMEMNGESE